MAESKRGRKSQANYRDLVAKALLSDRFTLEEFPVLSQLPAIQAWAVAHPNELLPHGKALQMVLRQAVADVVSRIGDADDLQLMRVVEYLRIRYQERGSVKAIADRWGCSTVHVWRTAGKLALDFVAERFLEIARQVEQKSSSLKVVSVQNRVPNIA